MRSLVFLAACLMIVESARIVRQVKEHVASEVWFVIMSDIQGDPKKAMIGFPEEPKGMSLFQNHHWQS